jgi:hypothetical protein
MSGGLSVAKATVGLTLKATATTASTSTTTGAIISAGGLGVAGAIYAGSTISTPGSVIGSSFVSDPGRSAVVTNNSSCWFYRTDGAGSGDFASAGHFIVQPRTTTGSARDIIFYTGDTTPTARMRVSSTGVVSIPGTADGVLSVSGKITAKAAVPASFADLAAVQAYLASILT